MSDRFPGEPEWTDALQTGRAETDPTATELLKGRLFAAYQSRKFTAIWDIVQAQMQINIAAESRAGDLEIETARLTTLVAEGERREALLTAMSITAMEYRQRVPHDMGSVEQRMEACERALIDAGFPWSDAK